MQRIYSIINFLTVFMLTALGRSIGRVLLNSERSGAILLFAVSLQLFAGVGPGRAQDEFDGSGTWRIVADEMHYNQQEDLYIASGDVLITNGLRELRADYIRYDKKNGKAHAAGRVSLKAENDIVRGDRAEMDLNTETGIIYNGTVFIQANHFNIKADTIEKTGEGTYYARDASITTCDGDRPDWKITGADVDVTLEGFGVVRDATFWAKRFPLLYSPVLIFPARQKRQSGFLMPEFGYSDRKGIEYNQPYFWAINDQTDATFYGFFMSERGLKGGAEYRYITENNSQGAVMFDALHDRRVDDGTEGSDQWGYTGDAYLRPNADRSWFRMKHDQPLPWEANAKIDVDVVSDQDYLLEFEDGYSGFHDTNEYFVDTFGRGLDDYNETVRKNQLNLNKTWSGYSLNGDVLWNDDVAQRRWEENDKTLHKMPSITFTGAKKVIGGTPLYWDLNTEYTHFYRVSGTRGHRADLYPRVYLPYAFQHYFSVEPSVGLRETVWSVDKWEPSSAGEETGFHREMVDVKLDLSSEVYSIYSMTAFGLDRLKHTIRPQVIYEYTPEVNQDRIPQFDDLDAIGKKDLITYSLTNTFTSRARVVMPPGEVSGAGEEKPQFDYQQFCYLKLSQSYDINIAREASDPEPFSDIYGLLELDPMRYVSFRADAKWSPYTSRFTSHNTAVTLTDARGDKFFNEYRFTESDTESILSAIDFMLTTSISLYGKHERNLRDGKKIESGFGLRYRSQCWVSDLGFKETEAESSIQVLFNLYGLGEAGTSFGNPF
jgi:LPS-assembly protein